MRNEQGFTLIEVCVAILLMALLLMTIAMMPRTIQKFRQDNERRAIACNLAESEVEQARSTKIDFVVSKATNAFISGGITYYVTVNVTNKTGGTYSGTATSYQNVSSYLQNTASTTPDFKLVTVTVTWTSNGKNMTEQRQVVINKY